ncbi:MAG: hypothetical protein M1838_003978 [Thelocarpon superellum]|nr:MAG: hypothetical protein M1838_003978 [Thelocarpon superellum]
MASSPTTPLTPSPAPSPPSTTQDLSTKVAPDPLADVPPLTTSLATEDPTVVAALRLVADSVAQQRQVAALAIIAHPSILAAYALLLAILAHFQWRKPTDWPVFFTTALGVTMAVLLSVRWAVDGYLTEAEKITWAWLRGSEENDTVLITRFGDEVIGTIIVRMEGSPVHQPPTPGPTSTPKGRRKNAAKSITAGKEVGKELGRGAGAGGKGIIRGWAVRLRYRGKGVGRNLLDEAIQHVRNRFGPDAIVEIAPDHASMFRTTSFCPFSPLPPPLSLNSFSVEWVAREDGRAYTNKTK